MTETILRKLDKLAAEGGLVRLAIYDSEGLVGYRNSDVWRVTSEDFTVYEARELIGQDLGESLASRLRWDQQRKRNQGPEMGKSYVLDVQKVEVNRDSLRSLGKGISRGSVEDILSFDSIGMYNVAPGENGFYLSEEIR